MIVLPLLGLFLFSCAESPATGAEQPTPVSASVPASAAVSESIRAQIPEALASAASGSSEMLNKIGEGGGEGAWYALSTAAADAGYEILADKLRIRSALEDSSLFGRLSLEILLQENPNAIKHPLRAIKNAVKKDGESEGLRRARISVLVFQGNERALVRELDFYRGRPEDAPVLAAALRSRRGRSREKAESLLPSFIARVPNPDVMSFFPNLEDESLELLRHGREAYALGDSPDALQAFESWLAGGGLPNDSSVGVSMDGDFAPEQGEAEGSPVFGEIARAAISTGEELRWAGLLKEFSGGLGGADRFAALYESGVLFRGTGETEAASRAFIGAAAAAPEGLLKDRALWQNLGLNLSDPTNSPEIVYQSFIWSMAQWTNADRFADRLDDYVHRLVGLGEWRLLERFYDAGRDFWPPTIRARTALILAWASSENRLVNSTRANEYLEYALTESPLSWAGLRAAGLLERDIELENLLRPAAGNDSDSQSALSGTVADLSDADKVIDLYLRWGMVMSCYELVLDEPSRYSSSRVRAVSTALAEVDRPRLSIRIMGLLLGRKDYRPSVDDLRLRYPLPYGDMARAAAEVYGVPAELFFGLIRTESAWDSVAVSRSGARGLAQFMPATWEEWTRRLRYPEDTSPDDPLVNLTLASAYLEWLYERDWTSGWPDVLVAYNAGGARLRSWRLEQGELGEHLFVESVPFEEPRSYVRKVLSAATLYGYLYADASPAELHRQWGLGGLSAEIISEE